MSSVRGLVIPLVVSLSVVLSLGSTARADMPADRYVEYLIREDPQDENSDIVFVVRLNLKASMGYASSIGWEVTEAEFEELDAFGSVASRWAVQSPEIYSGDGLWWVEHSDVEDPKADEFKTAPSIAGAAALQGATGADLNYSMEAGTLTQTEQGMYSGAVAGLVHSFQEDGEPEPIVEGDDEPTEIGGGRRDPMAFSGVIEAWAA